MKRGDKFFVADFDADGRKDFYVSNQTDWAVGYLMMFRSNGRSFSFVRRFDEELPGWDDMSRVTSSSLATSMPTIATICTCSTATTGRCRISKCCAPPAPT